jgi:hypothetical protein
VVANDYKSKAKARTNRVTITVSQSLIKIELKRIFMLNNCYKVGTLGIATKLEH